MKRPNSLRAWTLILGCASAIGSFCSPHVASADGVQDPHKIGKDLRGALRSAYRTLRKSGGLSGNGFHGTDITDVVLPYIPIGMSFDEAEAILLGGGFEIGSREESDMPRPPNRPKDWYAVVSSIPFFDRGLFMRVDLYVSLLPPLPGDYTAISKVTATIYVSMP